VFAMLQGPWPRITGDGTRLADLEAGVAAGRASSADLEAAVERVAAEAVAAQVDAGMGLVTDGGVRWADPEAALLGALRDGDTGAGGMLVRAWRATADLTDVPVAQAITGPWGLALADEGPRGDREAVVGRARELADGLASELEALAGAGCPLVQVAEPGATRIGNDERQRAGFLAAQHRLLRRAGDLHAMLLVTGGSAAEAGPEAIFGAPYDSYLFDLIAGPDNGHLVRSAPPERGIVCAALVAGGGAEDRDQAPQLVWAARYAASCGARGSGRVGLANASPLDGLAPDAARRAVAALVRAADLAAMPVAEAVEAGLDPRVVSAMSGPGPGGNRPDPGGNRPGPGPGPV
jgi:hypothetical protein